MAFRIRQDVYTIQTRDALLANSITVKVGDLLIPTAAGDILTNATAALAGDFYPIGVVQGFAGYHGAVLGTGTAQTAANTPAQVVTTATNTTAGNVDAIFVQYLPLTEDMELLGTLDAVAATTALSDKKYVYFNLLNANTIDESSVVSYLAGPLQLISEGLDPLDGTDFTVICRLVKNTQNRP